MIAVVFERVEQGGQVLRPTAPVQFRHPDHGFGQDRVQLPIEIEQIAAMVDKEGEVLGIIQVEAASQTGQDQA